MDVTMNDIIQVAVDAYHGNTVKYSTQESMDVLRKALVEANGGSTKLNYKNIRDGKCNGLFAIVEEILARTVVEGLQEDEFFNKFVDFRNVALGDAKEFVVEDANLFTVAKAADGTQGIRRQRLGGEQEVIVKTELRVVKIYEELNRVLSGRVDFNYMIQKVGESFRQQLLNDIYSLWMGATAEDVGGETYFPTAGAYDEETLLELIEHVEAAAGGKKATIIGTKAALRPLAPAVQGADSRSDLYNMGYYGKFYGADVVAIPQRHKLGTTEFVYDDKKLTIVAGDDKPIKCVHEGEPTIILGDLAKNADLTQDYLYAEKWGLALVLAGGNAGVGIYDMTTN